MKKIGYVLCFICILNFPSSVFGGSKQRGLSSDTSNYFALQGSDDVGNVSGLSDLASGSTNPPLFSGRADYTLCNYPVNDMKVIAGDFNNDGFSDLAASPVGDFGGSWQIAVLLNQGDGTFAAPLRYSADIFPDSLSAADVNGDGSLDLVVNCHRASGSPDSLAVLINQGTGTFGAPIITAYPSGRGSRHITTPDIDNDGDADVVVTNGGYSGDHHSSISLFFNDGSGGLSAEVNYPVGEDARATAVADVDDDGDKDLVTACYDQEMVWLMRNRGDATFDPPVNLYSLRKGNHSTFVVATDFDGDGHVDIAATNDYPDTIVFLRNDSSGNFDPAINYDVAEFPVAMEVVDYDLDGNPDILTCNHKGVGGIGGGISLLLNRGNGTFAPFQTYSLVPDLLSDFAAADFDGDGKQDIAVTFYNGTRVSVFFNSNSDPINPEPLSEIIGTWSNGIRYWDTVASKWTQMTSGTPDGDIAAGDFTGDGRADVASIWDNGLWYQDGATLCWTKVSGPGAVYLAAGDVTGDGRSEIIGTWSSGIWYWDVTAAEWTKMTASNPTGEIAAGDFTGDGKADVASIWGNGLWYQDGATLDWTKVSGPGAVYLAAGDVTGDGRSEIIGTWSSGIWYWDAAASKWTQMTSSTPDGDITAGDFTGDGNADVASCWKSGLWYQDGTTFGWTKVSDSAPNRLTGGDVTGK